MKALRMRCTSHFPRQPKTATNSGRLPWSGRGPRENQARRFILLPLPVRLKLSAELLRTIDARRKATGDQGIGSAVERDILDRELAELALEWMMNPESPRVPNLSRIR